MRLTILLVARWGFDESHFKPVEIRSLVAPTLPFIWQASDRSESRIEVAPPVGIERLESFLGLSREASWRPNLAAFVHDQERIFASVCFVAEKVRA